MQSWAIPPGTEPSWGVFAAAVASLLVLVPLRVFTRGTSPRGGMTRVLLMLAAVLAGLAIGCAQLGLVDAVQLFQFAALVALIAGLVGLLGFILFDLLLARAGIVLPPILRDLLEVAASVLITLALLRSWGFNVVGLVTTSAVLTAVVGLALQTTLANLFGGLALQLDRTVGQGDWVRVGNNTGRVVEVGWRATRLVATDGTTLIVPNGQLVAGELVNLSRPTHSVRRTVEVGFHYRHPPNTVRDVLLAAIRDVSGVLPQPVPDCLPLQFADSAIVYGLRFWVADFERAVPIEGEVRTRIWYAARRAGLEIPSPIRTLVQPEPVPAGEGEGENERFALLAAVKLFEPLGEAERRQVAATMRRLEFASGEAIVTQGAHGDSLYVVERGEVGVYLSVDRATRELATLHAGEVFGEMSLLTGEPRVATCIAHGDVACQVISRDAFHKLIAANPGIAVTLAAHVAARQVQIEASRDGLSAAARARRTTEEQTRLLPRIREFLGVS